RCIIFSVAICCLSSFPCFRPPTSTLLPYTTLFRSRPMGKPVFAGEEGICRGCGVATLSISYYDLGYTTGEMAAQILTGEADIARSEEHTSELQSRFDLVCRLLLEKKKDQRFDGRCK